jgi:hypothetical protein
MAKSAKANTTIGKSAKANTTIGKSAKAKTTLHFETQLNHQPQDIGKP